MEHRYRHEWIKWRGMEPKNERMESLWKRQGGRGQKEKWVRLSHSCQGVDIPDWCSRLVGSAKAGTRCGNSTVIVWFAKQLKNDGVRNNMPMSHETACVLMCYNWRETEIHQFDTTESLRRVYLNAFPHRTEGSCPVQTWYYSFSRLLWHIFPFTVYFFKAAHTQPLTEAEMTKTLYDVSTMTPSSQNLSHTHQNQTFPSKPTICAQLKMYVFSFI